jgi:hypothetical protein
MIVTIANTAASNVVTIITKPPHSTDFEIINAESKRGSQAAPPFAS